MDKKSFIFALQQDDWLSVFAPVSLKKSYVKLNCCKTYSYTDP